MSLPLTKVLQQFGRDGRAIGSKPLLSFGLGLTLIIKLQILSSIRLRRTGVKTKMNFGTGVTEC